MPTEPRDSSSVFIEKTGHCCIAFVEGEGALVPIAYDSDKVFGTSMNLQDARGCLAARSRTSSPVSRFLAFIQGDGYNLLTVEAVVFQVGDTNQGARAVSQITLPSRPRS